MAEKKKTPKKNSKKKTMKQEKPRKSAGKKRSIPTAKTKTAPAKKIDKSTHLRIVGIGASAGGLEAFGQFFTHMPSDSGMAFVLIPHLDPTHKSIMTELLRKYTSMTVSEVEEGTRVQPNCVYVIPPNKDLSILNGTLYLLDPVARRGQRHPIDSFFRSLAEDQGENAVCIVLSGTGFEGTLGLKSIKGEGGMVMVQDIESAHYDGMPRSAITTGLADYILPPGKMPESLLNYARGVGVVKAKEPARVLKVTDNLHKIFILIRNHTGHDFSRYKPNTIVRRIERRMALHQIENISDYVRYLSENPVETEMLFKELLIRVTQFFRDPTTYSVLNEKVLPDLLRNKSFEQPVRIWVPGCSTGEEAFSVAIMLQEYMNEQKQAFRVQIFATDIDHEAIEIARAAEYQNNIDADVSQERLKKFFIKKENTFKIKDEIREMVVFATQNIIKDPPFSKLDLISCRNLLIYLGPELQRKLLSIFDYALRRDGILVLGTSESIGDFSDDFKVVDKKWKIFRLEGKETHPPPDLLHVPAPPRLHEVIEQRVLAPAIKPGEINIADLTTRILLDQYTPACVIINNSGDILFVHGRTGKSLEPAPGGPRMNIFEMAREGLRLELRAMIRKTVKQKKENVAEGLQVRIDGALQSANVRVKPILEPNALKGLMMIIFEDVSIPKVEKAGKKRSYTTEKASQRIQELEHEIQSTNERLQTTIEELETTNEELQSTNEEMQSSNEELQSTNEELETSKEELQSLNEELVTVNTELQSKLDELSQVNNDMNNLFAGTKIATIFLDNDLHIKRFTPEAADVISLISTDIGRPLGDLVLKLEYKNLVKDVKGVLKTLISIEKEVQDINGNWFILRINPYRTMDNVIAGVVITFVNVSEQKQVQLALQDTMTYAENILETVREPLLVLDGGMKVLSANRSFYKRFRTTKKETEKHLIYEIGNHQWDIPKLRKLLEKILPKNQIFNDFEVEFKFPKIGEKTMLLNARQITQKGKGTKMILLAIEDITDHK